MSPLRQTYWSDDWRLVPDFKYFEPMTPAQPSAVGNPARATTVHCSVCKRSFSLGNMGRKALQSHAKGVTHKGRIQERERNYGIKIYASSVSTLKTTGNLSTPSSSLGVSKSETSNTAVAEFSSVEGQIAWCDARSPLPETAVGLHGLNQHLVKDDVTRAEILWCLHCVLSHCSMSAGGKAVKLFPFMFPDSIIASKMELGRLKLGYTVVHGLAPYFHGIVELEIRDAKFFVVMFDESLNKCSQKQQMDMAVKFWSRSANEVVTKYYGSAFLGRSRSNDLVDAFCEKFQFGQLDRLLMVGMDGPNVNFKFFRDLKQHLSTGEPDKPELLEMGSCGLHVLHNAFKEGVKATGWNIVMYLRATYNIFKDVPARRAKYTVWTGSSKFPEKYCAVRWLNNSSTADRGRQILPNIITFVEEVAKGGSEDKIRSATFSYISKAVEDNLLGPKLAFFSYVARIVEPFLTAYQTNNPMAPFLHTDLSALVRDLYKIFVKKEYWKGKTDVCDIDISKEDNLIPAKDIVFSFTVKDALNKVPNVLKKDMQKFKEECVVLLKAMTAKLMHKSPLKYKLCKAITFCDPELIAKSEEAANGRLHSCLGILQKNNWITASDCDTIESNFKLLLEKPQIVQCMTEYDRDTTRLDHHWCTVLNSQKCSDLLVGFIHMILIISHGNAFVERGFSINKEITVENQLDVSLVAQRQVYDAVTLAGGIEKLTIDNKMIRRVRSARSEYEEARKKRAKEDKEKEQQKKEEKRIGAEVKELKAKKMKLMLETQLECEAIDEKLRSLTS